MRNILSLDHDAASQGDALAARPAPGKRALTDSIPTRAIQRRAAASRGAAAPAATEPMPDPFWFASGPPASEPTCKVALPRSEAPRQIDTAGGAPLPGEVRAKMEHSFDADFSGVRVHSESTQASALGADAFAYGEHVHMAPGRYQPSTTTGQELLGHELTHVVQQRAGRVEGAAQGRGFAVNVDDALEREADVLGARAARGEQVVVGGGGAGGSPVLQGVLVWDSARNDVIDVTGDIPPLTYGEEYFIYENVYFPAHQWPTMGDVGTRWRHPDAGRTVSTVPTVPSTGQPSTGQPSTHGMPQPQHGMSSPYGMPQPPYWMMQPQHGMTSPYGMPQPQYGMTSPYGMPQPQYGMTSQYGMSSSNYGGYGAPSYETQPSYDQEMEYDPSDYEAQVTTTNTHPSPSVPKKKQQRQPLPIDEDVRSAAVKVNDTPGMSKLREKPLLQFLQMAKQAGGLDVVLAIRQGHIDKTIVGFENWLRNVLKRDGVGNLIFELREALRLQAQERRPVQIDNDTHDATEGVGSIDLFVRGNTSEQIYNSVEVMGYPDALDSYGAFFEGIRQGVNHLTGKLQRKAYAKGSIEATVAMAFIEGQDYRAWATQACGDLANLTDNGLVHQVNLVSRSDGRRWIKLRRDRARWIVE